MKTHIISALVCFALSFSINLKAQESGSITGTVVDAETGETLIGVNVIIQGTTVGTSTDLDGRYTIKNLDPGSYTLEVSYISFQKQTITGVEVKAGEAVTLDLALKPESEVLDDIVITARSVQNNEAALLSKRQKAIAFSNAISAETISQSGAGTAASAVKGISGASVQEGKYVVVRGLGGRYSNSQLNGANLPTADPDRNSAQLDLFPSELLDNVEIKKTFTPDQPGSFSGGNVNINTKAFPTSMILNFSTGISYNTKSSFAGNYISGPVGTTDWLGFSNGLRDIPDIVKNPDVNIPQDQFARRDPELAAQLDQISEAFNSNMVPDDTYRDPGLNNDFSFTFGNQSKLFGNQLGFIFSVTYSHDYKFYDDGINNQYVATSPEAEGLNADYTFRDTKGEEEATLGTMANVNYKLTDNHQVGFNYLRNQTGINMGRYQVGNFPKNIPSESVFFETYVTEYTERNVNSYQFSGKHYFPSLSEARLEWKASLADTKQEQPDLRFFFDQYVDVERPDTTFRVYTINLGSSNATLPTRLFRDLDEDLNQYTADLEVPFNIASSKKLKFKTGISYEVKNRTFRERKFDYNSVGVNFRDFNGDINAFFSDPAVGIIDTTNTGFFRFGNVIRDGSIRRNNYDGEQNIFAYYGMLEIPVFDRLRLIGGARFESTEINIVSQDSSRDAGVLNNKDILPSANLIFSLTDKMNLRASASQTLARPTFREIAPFTAFDFAGGRVTSGNPDLKRTLIQNYDVRWEWFINPGEVLAVSGFRKDFTNPIERVIISNNNQESYQNVENGQVTGLEFEFRKKLNFITPWLEYFTLGTNLALIQSKVDVPQRELEFAEGFDISHTRPLQGQSDYVANSVLSYENPESGTSISVSYNRFGKRLTSVGLGGTPSIFEEGRNDVYFSAKQQVLKKFNVKLSVSNLLNEDVINSQTFKGNRFIDSRINYGRTFKLSFSYNL